MKGRKYIVLQNGILEDLEKNVTELLGQGCYELVGGISVVTFKTTREELRWMYSQALVVDKS